MTEKTPVVLPDRVKVRVSIELDVIPRLGQSPEGAAEEITSLLTGRIGQENQDPEDSSFWYDYGSTPERIQTWLSTPQAERDPDDDPTWGGYDGPFVIGVKIEEQGDRNA